MLSIPPPTIGVRPRIGTRELRCAIVCGEPLRRQAHVYIEETQSLEGGWAMTVMSLSSVWTTVWSSHL